MLDDLKSNISDRKYGGTAGLQGLFEGVLVALDLASLFSCASGQLGTEELLERRLASMRITWPIILTAPA